MTFHEISKAKVADELIIKHLEDGIKNLLLHIEHYFVEFQGKLPSEEVWQKLYFFYKMHNYCIYFHPGEKQDVVDAGLAPLVSVGKFDFRFIKLKYILERTI